MKSKKYNNFIISTLILFGITISTQSFARDLSYRLGLGIADPYSNSTGDRRVPCLSLKYAFAKSVAVAGLVGIDTGNPSVMSIGGKFYKNLFFEDHMNFYWGVGLASLTKETTYLDFSTFLGSEFFIPSLESLGFSFEIGVTASGSGGKMHILTSGGSLVQTGIHFYF